MKRIILIIAILFSITQAKGQVTLGAWHCNSPSDSYPTYFDSLGYGGYLSVPRFADVLAIPTARRKMGMMVHLQTVDSFYRLIGGIANSNWVGRSFLSMGGSGGGGGTTDSTIFATIYHSDARYIAFADTGLRIYTKYDVDTIKAALVAMMANFTTTTTITGDATGTGVGTVNVTLASVGTAGTPGDATHVGVTTFNSKGLETGWSNVLITPAFASLTGVPNTLAGHSITDAYTKTQADGRYLQVAVTTVTAGAGLNGGTITSAGTISLPTTGTSGTAGSATQCAVTTYDIYGRETGWTNTTMTPDFADVTNKPTTSGGYGITDVYTKTTSDGKYIPFTDTGIRIYTKYDIDTAKAAILAAIPTNNNQLSNGSNFSTTTGVLDSVSGRVKYTDTPTLIYTKYDVDTGKVRLQTAINTKQATLSGTGIVKSTAGTISYINGTSSQIVKGDGSLDGTVYIPYTDTPAIIATKYDLDTAKTRIVGNVYSKTVSDGKYMQYTDTPATIPTKYDLDTAKTRLTNNAYSKTASDARYLQTAVTSVAVTGSSVFSVTGSPITSTGTINIAFAATTVFTITPANSVTVDANNGNSQTITMNRATTTFTISNILEGRQNAITLEVLQDGTGSRGLAMSTTVKVPNNLGGLPPISTTANAIDVWTIQKIHGNIWVFVALNGN